MQRIEEIPAPGLGGHGEVGRIQRLYVVRYLFTGADYDRELDYTRLASHLERIRTLMLDGQWRTPGEIAEQVGIPATADITKQLRHLRYRQHGGHQVDRRRRGETTGLYEYKVHPAGTWDHAPKATKMAVDLEIARLQVELLTRALARVDPNNPLLFELGV
jgi:hypothetical protein